MLPCGDLPSGARLTGLEVADPPPPDGPSRKAGGGPDTRPPYWRSCAASPHPECVGRTLVSAQWVMALRWRTAWNTTVGALHTGPAVTGKGEDLGYARILR